MLKGWVDLPSPNGLLHTRAGLPDRWDLCVERVWARRPGDAPGRPLSRRRLARAMRQDLWRALQAVRGFVPRVLVALDAESINVKAGGVLMCARPPALGDRLAAVLDNPENQKRWLAYARPKGDVCSRKF